MPRLEGDRQGLSDTITLHLRSDVLLSRRNGSREIKDRSLVWNFQVELPVGEMRMVVGPEGAIVQEILRLIGDNFRDSGFVHEIAERTTRLLAQEI